MSIVEGLRSQGFTNEDVAVRHYAIMQKFMGARNQELKRNLAREKYVREPPTVEALRFIVQEYLRIRGSARAHCNLADPQKQAPNYPQSRALPHLAPDTQFTTTPAS